MDGFRIAEAALVTIEPTVRDQPSFDDDLEAALSASGLPDAPEVARLFGHSADAFRRADPDYNASLTDARVALQTLATTMASRQHDVHWGSLDVRKWARSSRTCERRAC